MEVYDKKRHYENYQMKGSFLEKIFTFKIFFQISFFWFCFNSLMSTMEYLYFNTIKKEFISKRKNELEYINDSLTQKLNYLSKNIFEKVF